MKTSRTFLVKQGLPHFKIRWGFCKKQTRKQNFFS